MSAAKAGAARAGAIGGEAQAVRRRQLLLFSAVAAVVLAVLAVWLSTGGGERRPATARIDAELAGPGTAEDTWTRRSEARIGTIESQLRDMAGEARRLGAENERLRGRLAGDAADARSVIDKQKAMIDELGRELARSREAPETGPFGSGEAPRAQPGAASPAAPVGAAPMIERFDLEPEGSLPRSGSGAAMATPFTGAAKPVAGWLPAGSHAQAVVLAGVDASAGVSSQGDPRPVLLRIAGPAWTAAPSSGERRALSADIDGCTVTGAAHGDLSSEKVYVRLRTMTCTGYEGGNGDRDRGRRLRRGLGKSRGARPGGEPRRRLGPEGVPRGPRLRRRPGRRPGLPARGRRQRRRRGRRQHGIERYRPGRARGGSCERRAPRSPTT